MKKQTVHLLAVAVAFGGMPAEMSAVQAGSRPSSTGQFHPLDDLGLSRLPFEWSGPSPSVDLKQNYPLLGEFVSVGDVNGDSFLDLVVPAAGMDLDPTYFNEGGVWVIDGANKQTLALLTLGEPTFDLFYLGLGASCGDVDGDGFADVVAGYWDIEVNEYRMHLWHGPDLTRQDDWHISVTNHQSIRIEDLDHDGFGDVMNLGSVPGVEVFYGPDRIRTEQILLQDPSGMGDQSNYRMADFDADGHNDLAISVPGRRQDSYEEGGVWIVFGPDFTRQKLIRDSTPDNGSLFGYQLGVGDVNQDGFDDICISPRYQRCGGSYCGEIHLLFGPEFRNKDRRLFESPDFAPRIGYSLGMGDVDGDSWLDIVDNNAYHDPSRGNCPIVSVGIIHGPDFQWWEFVVPASVDCFESAGFDHCVVVDVNGDGRAEVFGGQPLLDPQGRYGSNFGRCLLLDFSSRDDWFSIGWPYPQQAGIQASVEVDPRDRAACTLILSTPNRELSGFALASFGLWPKCLDRGGFPGGDPTSVPTLFLNWPGSGVIVPLSAIGDSCGTTMSLPFRRRLEGDLSNLGLDTLYIEAFSFAQGLEHSKAVGVNLLPQ
jgi:FG-GAP repeat protein